MKKYIALFLLALLFPSCATAAHYENRSMDIRVDLPDAWRIDADSFSAESGGLMATFETDGTHNILLMTGGKAEGMDLVSGDTWRTRFASADMEKKMLDTMLETRRQKQPGVYFKSTKIAAIGSNDVLLTEAAHLASGLAGYSYTEANILNNGRMFFFSLSTNDKTKARYDEFLKMLESFRPLS